MRCGLATEELVDLASVFFPQLYGWMTRDCSSVPKYNHVASRVINMRLSNIVNLFCVCGG
ncbi:hypothetical protein C8R48DRAFT_369442 [Suillus tomentosus]|nr:hypothetical protein C8R48DRAFT_369442 [Suillus tomentosus]